MPVDEPVLRARVQRLLPGQRTLNRFGFVFVPPAVL